MDFEVEDSINSLEEPEALANNHKEEPPTLTIAERQQIILDNRSIFYKKAVWVAVVFCVASVLLMAGFKFNESFFDANSRISLLMERLNEEQEKLSFPKINVRANFIDERSSKLAIRLTTPIASQNVSVREEFTQNKLVITLSDASENISDGLEIVSDSTLMDAVGVYRQDTDVVVEIYCRDMYSWTLENKSNELSLLLGELDEAYDSIAVVYLPYEDKNRLVLTEWQQTLSRFASDNNIKLFLAYNMQENYTQEDIVEFANHIDADMLLGISVDADVDAADISAEIVCNSYYFIPEFASAQLAILMAETFLDETGMKFNGFRECEDNDIIVKQAVLPAAFIEISQPIEDYENVEASYKLNESIVEALKATFTISLEYTGGLEE